MIESKRFYPLLAGGGGCLLVHLLLDLVTASAGMDLATPTGRVRLITMAWSKGPAVAIADVCLVAAALGLGRGRLLRGLAKVQVGLGIVLIAAIPILLVSAGDMSSTIGGTGVAAFQLQMARVLVGLGLAGVTALAAARALPGGSSGAVPGLA